MKRFVPLIIVIIALICAAPMFYNPYWPPILEIINGTIISLIGVGWNGRTDPRTYGVVVTGASFATGSMTASSTTFTDTTHTPFAPTMNRIKIQNAKQAPDWVSGTYVRDNEVQPTSGNPGNFIYIENQYTCTTGGTHPAWNQTPATTTTDGVFPGTGCTWTNLGITSLSYVTTAKFINSSTVLLGLAPDVSSSTAQYVVGTDSTPQMNNAIAANTYPNGSGILAIPCKAVIFSDTWNVGAAPQANGHGIEIEACGWGSSMSTTNNIGDVIIYDGPGGTPMINVESSHGVRIHGLRLISNQFTPASACFATDNPIAGPVTEDSNAYDLWCGDRGPFPENDSSVQENECWQFIPTNGGNNGPYNFWNLRCNGWMDWGLDIPSSQFVTETFTNSQYIGQGLNYEIGGERIGASGINEQNTTFEQAGSTAIDMLPTGSLTAIGTHVELTGRLLVCDMNLQGAIGFGGGVSLTDTLFQLSGAHGATDGKILDCDQTAVGGAVSGVYNINIDNFQLTQNTVPFLTTTPTFALGSTSTGGDTYAFNLNVFGTNTLNWTNFQATTAALGNHAVICLNDVNKTAGRQNNCVDVTGSGGSLFPASTNGGQTPANNDEKTQPLLVDSGATLQQFTNTVAGGSSCTVVNSGSSTCIYKVSMKDRNGETIPFQAGKFTCNLANGGATNSAALGSQDNIIHFFVPDKGEAEYCFYGDNCAGGGTFKLLTGATNAGPDGCVPRQLADKTTLFPQVSLEDINLTRSATVAPTVDTSGMLALAKSGIACAGTSALSSGSPSTDTITNACITTQCRPVCTDETSVSALKCVPGSGSMAVVGPNTVTDTYAWACL